MSLPPIPFQILLLAIPLSFIGCEAFDVNVATEEPIKVDVNMRVDVYTHDKKSEEEKATDRTQAEVNKSKRDRMAEIQELKNNRFVGENHLGFISIRELPAGSYGEYVRRTVESENDDRRFLMTERANEKSTALSVVQRQQWEQWQSHSFPGEWIEVEKSPGDFEWTKKSR